MSVAISLVAIFSYSFSPVQAGLFSFIESLLKTDENTYSYSVQNNSQTIPILKRDYNPENPSGKGGGDITIVESSALLPDSGPVGTLADIENQDPNNGQISIYVVREGDSLSEIAKMFGVSVNTIIWANDIKRGDLIRVGQTLVILPVSGVQYTVKKGDTLEKIAKKFKGDKKEIIQYNGLDEDGTLKVGQTIIIPNGEIPNYKYNAQYTQRRVRGTGGPYYKGYYLRPIRGGVKSQGLHGYNAVDLATSCWEPVMAAASGDVIISKNYGWNAGYGKYVVIRHPNGTQTLYAHLSKAIVSRGWHVVKGQVIGYVGTTGKSTGCHLHFEIRGARNPF